MQHYAAGRRLGENGSLVLAGQTIVNGCVGSSVGNDSYPIGATGSKKKSRAPPGPAIGHSRSKILVLLGWDMQVWTAPKQLQMPAARDIQAIGHPPSAYPG